MTNLQLALSIGIPTLAVLVTFVYNQARFNSIEQRIVVIEGVVASILSRCETEIARLKGKQV